MSAWEFEPELEIANCFVEGRTEIEFFDSECSVQSNLPIPKQNEVYYWEAKIYDKPESSIISIGVSTKPYPLFRLPGQQPPACPVLRYMLTITGWHKSSLAYISTGHRRFNQPFTPTDYAPEYVQGDVIGVGYRPRTGTVFFTRNGKKLDDVAHGLKTQNFFPTVGANGPCTVHVNFGQSGFVFIEANVKKWGLAPMTGSLAPPPPYGSEQGSILLEAGRDGGGNQTTQSSYTNNARHSRSRSGQPRSAPPMSPGPMRSPPQITHPQLPHLPSNQDEGEGTSRDTQGLGVVETLDFPRQPPPEYTSPEGSIQTRSQRSSGEHERGDEGRPLLRSASPRPEVPSYDDVVGEDDLRRRRGEERRYRDEDEDEIHD